MERVVTCVHVCVRVGSAGCAVEVEAAVLLKSGCEWRGLGRGLQSMPAAAKRCRVPSRVVCKFGFCRRRSTSARNPEISSCSSACEARSASMSPNDPTPADPGYWFGQLPRGQCGLQPHPTLTWMLRILARDLLRSTQAQSEHKQDHLPGACPPQRFDDARHAPSSGVASLRPTFAHYVA